MAATAGRSGVRCAASACRRGRAARGARPAPRPAARAAAVAPLAAMASSPSSTPVPMKVMGSNIKLTDSIREHAEDKVGNAVRNYNAMVSHVDINLSVKTKGRGQKGADEHKAEVTVYTRRHGLIRAEERSANDGSVYESIDLVSDKLARKLRRTKEKTNNRVRHGREVHRQDRDEKLEEQMEEEIEIEIESKRAEMIERAQNTDSVVIRVKEFEMPPMTVRWPGARAAPPRVRAPHGPLTRRGAGDARRCPTPWRPSRTSTTTGTSFATARRGRSTSCTRGTPAATASWCR